MARHPRIEYPGAMYHIISRGNRQEPIYRGDPDCGMFLDTLDEACTKTGWRVHAFVLMGNHYHLLLETPEANLVSGMKWLQGTYTQRFNARHRVWGHLLQGRYKAILVEPGHRGYFSAVADYIHLNPARARVLDPATGRLSDYRWSSFPLYLRPSKRPDWLMTKRVLGELGVKDDRNGRAWYNRHMARRVRTVAEASNPMEADDAWAEIRRGWYLGSPGFRELLLERLDDALSGKKRGSHHGEEVRQHDEQTAVRLLQKGMSALGVDERRLRALPKGAKEKAALAWLLRKQTTVSRAWIADRLVIGDESRITKLVRAVEHGDGFNAAKQKLLIPVFTD